MLKSTTKHWQFYKSLTKSARLSPIGYGIGNRLSYMSYFDGANTIVLLTISSIWTDGILFLNTYCCVYELPPWNPFDELQSAAVP